MKMAKSIVKKHEHTFQKEEICAIREGLLQWYDQHRRCLPWRGDSPPYISLSERQETINENQQIKNVSAYGTWVSEIMCQQTRVETVIDYYCKWMEKFPTVESLAQADPEAVNAAWAGLGYYRRARMLHAGAKFVVEQYGGKLPKDIEKLKSIPGIGPYTAGYTYLS